MFHLHVDIDLRDLQCFIELFHLMLETCIDLVVS